MTTYLYGYSDDLIEVEGDIYEEFPYLDDWTDVIFSNGVHAQVYLGENWMIRVLDANGNDVTHYTADTEEAKSYGSYTELLAVEDAEWVIVGKKVNKRGT